MTTIFAKTALIGDIWQENVLITIDEATGLITSIKKNTKASGANEILDIALPAMSNIHSHAFQRAMAGMTEYKSSINDSFWTWRELMYKFANQLSPDDVSDIASYLYLEMLKAGYSNIGEFHYLHHDKGGRHYQNITEMSDAIINAASKVGIAITHLPVFYRYSGFGKKAPLPEQVRFINNIDSYLQILEKLNSSYKNSKNVKIGIAYHSLRAITIEDIKATLTDSVPIHIHIAEQMAEVEDCLNFCGRRPVEYLFDNIDVRSNWSLIHATHIDGFEVEKIAKAKAVVGICPVTEANLGDGIFPLKKMIDEGGRFAIGTDSHVSVSMADELRILEYSQRLNKKLRVIAKDESYSSVGGYLYRKTSKTGAQALGQNSGVIAKDMLADILGLDSKNIALFAKKEDFILDSFIFACPQNPINFVMVAGKAVIKDGHHSKEAEICKKYKQVLKKLIS